MIGLCGYGKIGKPIFERLNKKYQIKIIKNESDLCNINTLIDFSNISCENLIKIALKNKINVIMGTTGYSNLQLKEFEELAKNNHVLFENCANYANEMNLFLKLCDSFKEKDVKIIETHDIKKNDCPSGTALMICRRLNIDEENITSIRKSGANAFHKVIFKTKNEEIMISHKALNKKAYVEGFYNYFNRLVEENDKKII